ncbi:hypothetical protein FKW77_002250 [Venturia effusa]|uniref:Helicase ATP-binding domain-containing protein n=1 Tax=Venturia effusa TaxID=50376 RepID=A0A517L0W2_9PEZI|nr:hypothetical protein FKW77_002250 [Venturia effusa]
MSANDWFVDRFLDELGNMPPKPVYKRYFEHTVNGELSQASVSSSAAPTMPVLPAAPAIDSSEPTGDVWVTVKGKHKRDEAIGSSSRARQAAVKQHNKQHEDRSIEAMDMNADICEKLKPKLYHRRDRTDAAGEAAATLKQHHSNAIRLYFQRPPKADPSSWVSCGEIPTTNEIMDFVEEWQKTDPKDDSVILRGNNLVGPWDSKDAYLGAHFEMLREDVSRPLREAVSWVKKFPDAGEESEPGGNIGIYTKVRISGITFSKRGLGIRVVFSLTKVGKNIRWEQSKRLLTGSLVALTPSSDMFQSKHKCIIAVVAGRPIEGLRQNPPEIDLFFENPGQLEIDPFMEFTMVEERSSFFEADRHTMKALQKMMGERSPLSEHLIDVNSVVDAPEYVLKQPIRDMSSIFTSKDLSQGQYDNIDVISEWPEDANTSLDSSQEAALRRIMTKKVAIVQGPPGTGKTHVSVMSLKAMLDNMRPGDPPIVVACQTNHALDQLLRHIAAFELSFARLGGRSKDTGIIKERTLFNLRQGKNVRVPGGMRHEAKISLDNLTRAMSAALTPLEMSTSLLNHELLFNLELLTAAQCESLIKGDPKWSTARSEEGPALKQWMGKQLISQKKAFEQDTFGYDYEEADLEFEQLRELEAENCAQDDDDDFESLHGHHLSLWDAFVGKTTTNVSDDEVRALLMKQDLYQIQSRFRGAVYNYLLRQVKDIVRKFIREQAVGYDHHVTNFRAGGWERDAIMLRQLGIKLIGMTTTGLSKYRALVSALSPKIVVIEEAAETMEAPVISACVPTLQHLILVGDHKQLRPQCAVKGLQRPPFSLNVSLFERLIMNKLEYTMLKRQRRMIPEIRRILKPIYGKEIVDHPSMTDIEARPPVPGLGGCNSFFYTHSWPEGMDEQNSWMNHMEADMIVGFFGYLIDNGITEKQVTVLTFYHGQRKLLLRKLREHPQLGLGRSKIYKVVTVDSYQGEENDVVILSMVRSNDMGKIGFLDVENRVCVALSRAKRGFFIFGNAELLCGESKLWSKVISIMAGKKREVPLTGPKCRVVFRVPLVCSNHGRKTWIEEPDDYETIHGGCRKKCCRDRKCGHQCQLFCHPFDCNEVFCEGKCTKILSCGHACTGCCGDICKCAQCKVKYGGLGDAVSQASDSSIENWAGYAQGGHLKHDDLLREKRREMNRLAAQETDVVHDRRLDEFLAQQTERIASPALRATNLPPPSQASTLSTSPGKGSNNLSSWADATRGSQAKFTATSEPLIGYTASVGSKGFASKIDGQRQTNLQKSVHPQHALQHQEVKPKRSKPRGLENSVKRMAASGRISVTENVHENPAATKPADETNGLLIDFS